MKPRPRSAVIIATAILLGVLSGNAPAAATPPAPAAVPSNAVKAEARERFDLGLGLFEKGENAAALAEFKRAYDLIPNVMVLFNMGLVYAAMNRPVEAADTLELVLAPDAGALGAAQKQKAQRVRDEQAARIAQVLVVTNQPATIEIDGVEAGRTPLARPLRVASGTHVVSAVAPGTLPTRREVTLAGQITETVTLTLQPTESGSAHLVLTVSVPGANVVVNDKPVGQTPLPASIAVPPGPTRVEVRRAGYRTASKTLRLDEGASGTMELTLEEDPGASATLKGSLRVAVSEPGAEASIDGVSKPMEMGTPVPIIAGPHNMRIVRAGFEPFEQRIEIVAGKETSLVVSLVPTIETKAAYQESARVRRVVGWSTVAAGALVAAGGAIYAVLTRDDIPKAQADLDGQLAMERMPGANCYNDPNALPGAANLYLAFKCGERKAFFQDSLDSAKLHRGLAYGGIGLGVVIASVGTYLLATGPAERTSDPSPPRISLWGDGQAGGVIVAGRF